MNKLELHSPKDAFSKFGWFWRRRLLKFCLCIFANFVIFTLEKGCDPSCEQTWILFTQGWIVLYLVEIGPGQWFWRRWRKCEKFTTTTMTTDNLIWVFGLSRLKIIKSLLTFFSSSFCSDCTLLSGKEKNYEMELFNEYFCLQVL